MRRARRKRKQQRYLHSLDEIAKEKEENDTRKVILLEATDEEI